VRALLALALLAFAAPAPAPAAEAAAPAERTMAVTIDDLPAPEGSVVSNAPAALAALTERLLAALAARRVPAIGFVNEGKLDVAGETPVARAQRVALLRRWVDAGLELGNHSYSHASLNKTPLDEFQADVVRGEPVTKALLAERDRPLRYFRHPFLQVGLELEKRRAFEAWLAARGYTVAPVTIDNDEWVFAALYADALRRGDRAGAERLAAAYLDYMVVVVEFIETISRALLGREPAQILLIHANELNADHLGALLDRIAVRGYRFVPLDEALRDSAYVREDSYVGVPGISWLHHWEITAGRKRTPSPDPPAWVLEAHAARSAR
jgi:peptidoglycan/xylan/chitin deacetylase (PgdA/CDA1 family)